MSLQMRHPSITAQPTPLTAYNPHSPKRAASRGSVQQRLSPLRLGRSRRRKCFCWPERRSNAIHYVKSPAYTAYLRIPIYERPLGFGFVIVVEGGPGDDVVAVGSSSFDHDPDNPGRRPDVQILTDRHLGNGSAEVCGHSVSTFGGVQAVPSLGFEVTQPVSAAINDFGCRFIDGTGRPRGRLPNSACVLSEGGVYQFATAQSQIQFCATVSRQAEFSVGDTRLRVRLRNVDGQTGGIREIIVRSLN